MRINGFEQIKGFYSWVFANQRLAKSHHTSLYMFFINQNNRNGWAEWFKCPYDLGMAGAGIGSKSTYYKTLNDLQNWGLLKYQPGANEHKAPLISLVKLEVQKCTSTVPQCEPLPEPLVIPLPEPLVGRDKNLLTSNIKPIIDNIDKILLLLKNEGIEGITDPTQLGESKNTERCNKAIKLISEFFNLSEVRTPRPYMQVGTFVRYLESKGKMDELAEQFTAYRNIKEKEPKFKHNFRNYIGTPEKSYEDGAWCEKDWVKTLNESETKGEAPTRLSYSIADKLARINTT